MNEFELIAHLTGSLVGQPHLVVGPGDDCAVLEVGLPDRWLLFKTDSLVEGTHFLSSAPADRVGRKALARVLSDVAAMAGDPLSVLVTLGLPETVDPEYLVQVYSGIRQLAGIYGVSISGGETTSGLDRMILSLALVGTVDKRRCILRSGAKAGDALFVTGELGGSLGGRHLEFEPRLREARWLAEHFPLHAMIDLSDGLAGDLRHVLTRSEVGADLRTASIPISRAAREAGMRTGSKPPLKAALTDGEDYELLFTVAAGEAVRLLDEWKEAFPALRLTCIGRITETRGLRIQDETGTRALDDHAYDHFQKRG